MNMSGQAAKGRENALTMITFMNIVFAMKFTNMSCYRFLAVKYIIALVAPINRKQSHIVSINCTVNGVGTIS